MKFSDRDSLGYLVLAVAILTGLMLRFAGTLEKRTIEHDEAVSYLIAAGHLGAYMTTQVDGWKSGLSGRWVPASDWKRFLEVENQFCFKQIGSDVARRYLHPPLYFWLLHLWVLVFGAKIWVGLSLNLVIFLFTAVALFRLGYHVFRDTFEASFVCLLWALSPATIVTSLMARNWDLLTLVAVLFALLTARYVDDQRKPGIIDLLFLAFVACVGVLTHYQFLVIVLPAGVLLAALKLARRDRKKLFLFVSSIVLGCLIAYCLHPDFRNSFLISQDMAHESFDLRQLPFRILVALACFGSFFMAILQKISDWGLLFDPTHSPPFSFGGIFGVLSYYDLTVILIVALILAAMGWSFFSRCRAGRGTVSYKSLWDSPKGSVMWFGFFLAGSITFEYLTFVLDRTAMRERYLSMIWPFVALGLVLVVRHTGRKALFSAVLIGLFVFQGVNQTLHFRSVNARMGDADSIMAKATSLVMDTFNEGKLLPVLWHVPDEKKVFVGSQEYLLEDSEKWLEGLQDESIIVSVLGYAATLENQERIVRIASTKCKVSALNVPTWKWTTLFRTESCDKGHGPAKEIR